MILKCPHCATKYNFPDERYKEGAKVKCTRCKHVFAMSEDIQVPALQKAAPKPKPKPAPAPPTDDDIDALFEDDYEPPPTPKASPAAKSAASSGQSLLGEEGGYEDDVPAPSTGKVADEFNIDGDSDLGFDIDAMSAQDHKKSSRGKLSPKMLAIALGVLLILVGTGLYFSGQFNGENGEDAPADDNATAASPTDEIKEMVLDGVKQFYIENEKVGQILVIEGKVVNNFPTPKELIKIETTLYDANGAVVLQKVQLIGNTLSLYQLQLLSEEELTAAINNKVGQVTANTNIAPGGSVPFVTIFPNPPNTVAELGLRVVQAKDPPK